MAAHEEILQAARQIAAGRKDWTFTPDEIVNALPHLNAGTIRTHITSRCCTNAPKNHPHKWDYFIRVGRGRYQLSRRYRPPRASASIARESRTAYTAAASVPALETIHAAVRRAEGWYSAECLEVAVVTQGRTLDQTIANLREAVRLHLEEQAPELLAPDSAPSLQVVFDTPLQ